MATSDSDLSVFGYLSLSSWNKQDSFAPFDIVFNHSDDF